MPKVRSCSLMKSESPYKICERMKGMGVDEVFLSFSCGKDSLACWCALRHAGIKVIPVHFLIHPELQIIHDTLDFYEDFFQTKIHRLIHPCYFDTFKHLIYVNPYMLRIIESFNIYERPGFETQKKKLATVLGKKDYWQVRGIKAKDSMIRFYAIRRAGVINPKTRVAYPMVNCGDRITYSMLIYHKVPLPDYYEHLGESLDLITAYVVRYLKQYAPEDYERVKLFQQLIDLEEFRACVGSNTEYSDTKATRNDDRRREGPKGIDLCQRY